jgi:hypothetical protein
MKPTHHVNERQMLTVLIGLLLGTTIANQTWSAIVSDFDDGAPDWDGKQVRGADFSESGGRLVASGTIPAKVENCITWNLTAVWWNRSVVANEGEVLSFQVDLVESSHNDVQVLLEYTAYGTGGYALIKDEDEIWLTKFDWSDCGVGNAPFFYEPAVVKNERVRLVLELKPVDTSMEITSKVLDLDDGGAVLFERTVIDTAAVDPTISSFRGYAWSADSGPPILGGTRVGVAVINVANTPQSAVRFTFDNLIYERRPVLKVKNAVRLSWPVSSGEMEVLGAPNVDGPWTPILEPIMESDGAYLMTVPAPLSETMRYFRLEEASSP